MKTKRLSPRSLPGWAALALAAIFTQAALASPKQDQKGAEALATGAKRVSRYSKLPSELDVVDLRPLVEAYERMPETVTRIVTRHGSSKPLTVAVREHGFGTNQHVIVAIHGVLANHLTWRYLVGALGPEYDYWLVDLPGCGDSDKPSPTSLGPEGYGPYAMADRLLQVLQAMLATRGTPPRLTILAHSLGGMIALRMESDPELRKSYGFALRQIDQMVLLAPCDVGVRIELQKMSYLARISGTQVIAGNALGMVRDKVAMSVQNGIYHRDHAIREQVDQMHRTFSRSDERHASQAMIRQAVPGWDKDRRPDNAAIGILEHNYRNIDVPCLILWGECDDTLPEWMGHAIKDHIPGAQLVTLEDSMHSPQIEAPHTCAQLLRQFRENVVVWTLPPGTKRFAGLN